MELLVGPVRPGGTAHVDVDVDVDLDLDVDGDGDGDLDDTGPASPGE